MPKQQNKKPKTGSQLERQFPEADPAPATSMQAKDPVDDYIQKTYPGLTQNIPYILHAILREIVIGRLK